MTLKETMHAKKLKKLAQEVAHHEYMQEVRKAAADPQVQQAAAAYFNTLDDSHRAAFIKANPYLEATMTIAGLLSVQEINRLLHGNGGQTADGHELDLSAHEDVFTG